VRLQELAASFDREGAHEFRRQAKALVRWGPLADAAWPIGQGIALAEPLRKRYRTTGRLLQAIGRASRSLIERAGANPPLAPQSAFARAHRIRFPIVQGAMTRVSDSPEFAAAVADAGALPLLALALMTEEETRTLLRETRAAVGERSWGVGILGFVPQEKREAQMRAIAQIAPPFALIAGGRPDQAAELESHGVATYLHTPVPGLLCRFLDQGCRHFAFEGRECGGHVGPLFSFPLWQVMVETLLERASDSVLRETRVLFAGGIHDALSAAMVSAIAAPLVERGVEVGVILGSAYLFTEEAVATGAISDCFQRQALDCGRTVVVQTGLGHVIRAAPTPFIDEFEAAREQLLKSAASAEAMRATLDDLGLGRARIASKGLVREGERLVAIDAQRQEREGMFMMGSLATLRQSIVPMAALHESVCQGSADRLAATARETGIPVAAHARSNRARPAKVAIVGMSCLLPGAQQIDRYWRNLLTLPELVTEVPRHRWDWRIMYSEDPKAHDTTYSKWGGFFDEVAFDPLRYGIPPNSMKSLSTSQLLALEVTRWALVDAGYEDGDFDRENTAVIVGTGANGDLEQHYMLRTLLPLVVENLTDDDLQRLPTWTEESFAGVLANVTAGRIANRFDLGGANYTVDEACASGLTVIDLALSELRGGRSNVVLAAGLDFEQTPYFYQGFSRVQAVSPRGRARTFDRDADGIVISEGMAMVVLKRLDDAVRDGDRIYSVIQSATGSSDGKALGMTAPRSIGQRRALRRAYEEAGVSPAQIGLYEAHGTGTPVGDKAEVETIHSTLLGAGASPKSCAIGSVKSLLGHTKAAAGVVGLVKAALALHHRTLPPHANVERPLPDLADPASPLYLLREPRPWLSPAGEPRRAGVSAFGFGGTNYHAVLE
ncbi:MAG: 6-deoxyerythronolide-B synthase, partial [Betaproteobacteria bacterium]|nr:6-deoxyerythronolide-B synthase [Betaproteobacteria bacterium]